MTAKALKAKISRLTDAIHGENRLAPERELYRARFKARLELDRLLDRELD